MSLTKFLIRLAIGVAFVVYLLAEHEVTAVKVLQTIEHVPVMIVLAAIAMYLLGELMCVFRWAWLSTIGGHPATYRETLSPYFSGMFFNICLPTSIGGDVMRVVGLGRHTKSKTAALASVFMDRNVGLSALLAIGLMASATVSATLEITIYGTTYYCALWPLFVLLIAGYVLANVCLFHDTLGDRFVKLLTRCRLGFIAGKVEKLHASLREYHQPLSRYAGTFGLSVLYQLNEIGCVWLLASALDIPVSPLVYFAIIPFQAVASLLPITFSGMGVREGIFCAVIMGQAGAAYKDEALALSLMFFGVVIVCSLSAGLVYMLSGMVRPSQQEIADAAAAEAAGGG